MMTSSRKICANKDQLEHIKTKLQGAAESRRGGGEAGLDSVMDIEEEENAQPLCDVKEEVDSLGKVVEDADFAVFKNRIEKQITKLA